MREEDDVERSGGHDREKSSRYTEGEGEAKGRERRRSATLKVRCEVGVLERVGRESRRGRRRVGSSEKRGEMGYVAVERG